VDGPGTGLSLQLSQQQHPANSRAVRTNKSNTFKPLMFQAQETGAVPINRIRNSSTGHFH
jgi:hypothetical protein